MKNLRELGTKELCQWLRFYLDHEDWKDVQEAIRKHKIKGNSFIDISKEDWLAIGLSLGVAISLVQLSQRVIKGNSEILWIEKLKNVSPFENALDNPLFFPSSELPMDQSYLNLRKLGVDTFDSPTFFVIAPTGSGKTKLVVDLALVKGEYVIYIDCRRHVNFFDLIKRKISNLKSFSAGLGFIEEFLSKLLYCSTLLVMESIVKSAEEFFKYWAGIDTSQLTWILDAAISSDRAYTNSHSFIFAFDEFQELLGSIEGVTQDLKSSECDQELNSSQSSLCAT
jgi:hypothetical protein